MARLIHLNGPPGIGKSTIAKRYVDEHPEVLNCDIDVLRTLVGGWSDDFAAAGELIRPAALAMIGAYLGSGHDVVLPQMILRPVELARFKTSAEQTGARFVERFLMDDADHVVARFARRGVGEPDDPWHDRVRAIVAANGGDESLLRCHAALLGLLERRPGAVVVESREGETDATYQRLIDTLD